MDRSVQRTYKIRLRRCFVHRRRTKEKKAWFKVRHMINRYIRVARRIATFTIKHRDKKLSSKSVKCLGKLPSAIANQIIRKYKKDYKCYKASRVNLFVPSQHTSRNSSIDYKDGKLIIKVLKLQLKWKCPVNYHNICQAVINKRYVFVTLNVPAGQEDKRYRERPHLGVDVNMKPALLSTATVQGDHFNFIGHGIMQKRLTYRAIRSRYQRQGRLIRVRQMNDREHY